jgi:uncharacterized protein (DUF2141 family)
MKAVLAPLAILAVLSLPAQAASLTIKLVGISDRGGTILVSAFDEQGFPPGSKPLAATRFPATPGEMTVTLDNLPAGWVGVRVLQDLNGNGQMDFSMGVFPTEPYGFSNNPVIKMGPPAWDDLKFDLKPGANAISIKIH